MTKGAWENLRAFWRCWRGDQHGGIVVGFAIAVPIAAIGAVCAVELSSLSRDKTILQSASDAAALAAANELTASSMAAVAERAKSFADSQLAEVKTRYAVTIDAAVSSDPAQVKVDVSASRQSFFGNLVPPGGFLIHASSTAGAMGTIPLCVLAHHNGQGLTGSAIQLENKARMEAGSCLVQSNDDLTVKDDAILVASATRAAGLVSGAITPSAHPSAPVIPDPFADVDVAFANTCPAASLPTAKISGAETLPAGIHCGGLEIRKEAVLTLAPGEHYFVGDVKIEDDAQFTGTDVVLIFDKDSKFEFKDNSRISLEGRRTGELAGFVVATTRTNVADFHMNSARVERLLGTLYIPSAKLIVEGNQKVAQDSPWTVIVARQIKLRGSPNLVINAQYAASNVPVPIGVGPNSAQSHLVR